MSNWREAKSLLELRDQVNAKWPTRSKDSDGTIGDEAHQHRVSDHDPDENGIVTAMDITHDPKSGCDSYLLAEMLRSAKDGRIKYIISNRKIASGSGQDHQAWVWRPYTGANPHDHHVHISVKDIPSIYDDVKPWNLGAEVAAANLPDPKEYPTPPPTLKKGVGGVFVAELQKLLNANGAKLRVDGDFGDATYAAVRKFQSDKGIVVDGKVGPHTWSLLMPPKQVA